MLSQATIAEIIQTYHQDATCGLETYGKASWYDQAAHAIAEAHEAEVAGLRAAESVAMDSATEAQMQLLRAKAEVNGLLSEVKAFREERDIAWEKADALEARLAVMAEGLNWLVHLCHGCSKGGDEFSPPSMSEWEDAIEAGKQALAAAPKVATSLMMVLDREPMGDRYLASKGVESYEVLGTLRYGQEYRVIVLDPSEQGQQDSVQAE